VANNASLKAAGISLAEATHNKALVFQSSSGQSFEVMTAGDVTNILGLGTYALNNADAATSMDYTEITSAGTFAANGSIHLELSINGSPSLIDTGNLAYTGTDATARRTNATQLLNDFFASDAASQKAGLHAIVSGSDIKIESLNGTAFRVNTRVGSANLNFNGGATAAAITANLQDVVRGTSAQTAFAGATGDHVTVSVNGTETKVDLSAVANIGDAVTALGGVAGMAASTVDGRTILKGDAAGTKIQIVSGSAAALAALGVAVGDTNVPDKATVTSGGAYNTALGENDDVFSYSIMRNALEAQTLNLVANDSDGTQHSLAVVLQNNSATGGVKNARSLDEALYTINQALQASADPVLKSVVAVKETTHDGRMEGIRFLSTQSNFRVSVGTVGGSTASSEVGVYDGSVSGLGQGSVYAAEQAAGGSQVDISSQAAAEDAVNALASAVNELGSVQANVGKGQNQFSYAISLAHTQIANLSAAESRIRDADLAVEAANLTKAQILQQAGVAALAQANSAPQAILSLLRG
jgi:flagellin